MYSIQISSVTLPLLATQYPLAQRLLAQHRLRSIPNSPHDRAVPARGVVMGSGFDFPFNGATFHQTVIPRTNVTLNTASDKFTDIVARISLDYKFDIGAPVQTRY